MHHATMLLSRVVFAAAVVLLVEPGGRSCAADPKHDEYEQERVERFADRIVRIVNTDHTKWFNALQKAYPRQVTEPTKEEEYASWFELLSGGDDVWRRVGSRTSEIAALFDRVVDSRNLGPVPAITREEFMRFADRVLDRSRRRAMESVPEYDEEADRVFRVLDRDGDGLLFAMEMTTALRKAGLKGDSDANGRVDQEEYRAYFQSRVAADNKAALARAKAREDDDDRDNDRDRSPKQDDKDEELKLPEWFAAVDADEDGQIALHEWRKAGGAIDFFLEMDLNEDGLLTEPEYWRWVKMNDQLDWDDPPADDR